MEAASLPKHHQVLKAIHFCYGHRLLRYQGKCKNLHGHNGKLEIVLVCSRLDDRGMVVDFSDIKSRLGRWVDENLDHRLILNRRDPWLAALKKMDPTVKVVDFNPTAENLARLVYDQARRSGFDVAEVRLWETESSCAIYKG